MTALLIKQPINNNNDEKLQVAEDGENETEDGNEISDFSDFVEEEVCKEKIIPRPYGRMISVLFLFYDSLFFLLIALEIIRLITNKNSVI